MKQEDNAYNTGEPHFTDPAGNQAKVVLKEGS